MHEKEEGAKENSSKPGGSQGLELQRNALREKFSMDLSEKGVHGEVLWCHSQTEATEGLHYSLAVLFLPRLWAEKAFSPGIQAAQGRERERSEIFSLLASDMKWLRTTNNGIHRVRDQAPCNSPKSCSKPTRRFSHQGSGSNSGEQAELPKTRSWFPDGCSGL